MDELEVKDGVWIVEQGRAVAPRPIKAVARLLSDVTTLHQIMASPTPPNKCFGVQES